MLFWLGPSLLAILVALVLLRALASRDGTQMSAAESDMVVYRDQLKEVERDLARGVLTETEAETVRTEVSRRLLEADKRSDSAQGSPEGRTWPAAAAVVALVMAGSFLLYARLGAPGVGDLPMKQRIANLDDQALNRIGQVEAEVAARPFLPEAPEPDQAFLELMERLRAALLDRHDDLQGLTLLAQNEARLGNYTAAREAQERLVAAMNGAVPYEERIALLELMVFAAGGYVSPEAETLLRDMLAQNPQDEPSLYYAGLLQAQLGRPDRAFPIWRRLLETSPPDAPWIPVIRSSISDLAAAAGVDYVPTESRGPSEDDIAAAGEMTPEERQEMIRGMVDGLSDRLASDGGPPEDWARLITALGVLGETARARAIADEAEQVFAGAPEALAQIEAARVRAGLSQ